jgi:hypothetical protein
VAVGVRDAGDPLSSGANVVGDTTVSGNLIIIGSATPQVLPVNEVITTKDETKSITFTNWSAPCTVTTPASAIPYPKVTG